MYKCITTLKSMENATVELFSAYEVEITNINSNN